MKKIKPLFKYIGGKSWLRESLREKINNIILLNSSLNTYVEPFAGGLGSFLSVYDILLDNGIKKIVLSDINETLIHTYNVIKNNPQEFINEYLKLEQGFVDMVNPSWKSIKDKQDLKIILKPAEAYFKQVKRDFNDNKLLVDTMASARLVFLQKHSFNGIYRENSKGHYNTPFNWSGSDMLNEIKQKVNEINELFNKFDLKFVHQSFEMIEYNNFSIYYLDPPYINENFGENKYNKNLFSIKEQILLINKIKDINFIYSNHKSEILIEEFNKIDNILIQEISRKNIMSSTVETRNVDKVEILVTKN